jgi:hypothetical protein
VVLTNATVPAGGTLDTTATLTGLTTGQKIAVGAPATLPAGLMVMGFASAANTVTLRVSNVTGVAVTGVSGTFNVQAIA